jgi:hypothetical protein
MHVTFMSVCLRNRKNKRNTPKPERTKQHLTSGNTNGDTGANCMPGNQGKVRRCLCMSQNANSLTDIHFCSRFVFVSPIHFTVKRRFYFMQFHYPISITYTLFVCYPVLQLCVLADDIQGQIWQASNVTSNSTCVRWLQFVPKTFNKT